MMRHPFYMERFFAKKRERLAFDKEELLALLQIATREMRTAQRRYFRHRNSIDLAKAKEAECYVDAVLQELDSSTAKEL